MQAYLTNTTSAKQKIEKEHYGLRLLETAKC